MRPMHGADLLERKAEIIPTAMSVLACLIQPVTLGSLPRLGFVLDLSEHSLITTTILFSQILFLHCTFQMQGIN